MFVWILSAMYYEWNAVNPYHAQALKTQGHIKHMHVVDQYIIFFFCYKGWR